MRRAIAVKVGRRWAAVLDYGQAGTGRQGCWCEDAAGGWGVSRLDPTTAVRECVRSRLYATQADALDDVDPLGEMDRTTIAGDSPAAAMGRAGKGAAKVRGDAEHYRALAVKSAAVRRAKRDEWAGRCHECGIPAGSRGLVRRSPASDHWVCPACDPRPVRADAACGCAEVQPLP